MISNSILDKLTVIHNRHEITWGRWGGGAHFITTLVKMCSKKSEGNSLADWGGSAKGRVSSTMVNFFLIFMQVSGKFYQIIG